jgi:thiol-disulfide isomerase/thioredoxin
MRRDTHDMKKSTITNYRLVTVAAALVLLLCSLSCSSDKGSSEGGGAPDFVLTSLDGQEVRLSQYRGKVVILDFWATWCPPCKLALPHFIELHQELKDDGLVIIGVSLDKTGVREVASFVKEWKIPYIVVMGTGEVARSYGGIRGIPTTFVIGKDGKVYRKYVGYRKKEVFEKDVLRLLKEV